MKKILVAIIIIAMVFTSVFSTIQLNVAAEEGSDAPVTSVATGADVNTAGNKMTPGSGTYLAEDGWVGVGSWSALTSALAANAKIYLTGNINAGSGNAGTSNGGKTDGAIIDGNGYTITATGPLFQHTNNITLQNLTLNSTLNGLTAGATPLAYWETKGYTKAYNVTVNSTVTPGAVTSGSQSYSGFTIYAQSGSVFENVAVNTTLTLTNEGLTKVNSVGVIAGRANKATFNNCITKGTIIVGANAFVSSNQENNGVGGIVGQEIDACAISNCTNEANITVTAPLTNYNRCFGGIVGYSDGITLTNCLNKGDILVQYTKTVAVDLTDNGTDADGNPTNTANDAVTEDVYVGGAVGYFKAASTLKKVENQGNITVNITATGTMKAADDNATAANATITSYVGGIIGYTAAAAATVNGVLNQGSVSATNNIDNITINGKNLNKIRKAYAAGVVAYTVQQVSFPGTSDMVTTYNAKNTGDISSDYYAGGIIAHMQWGAGITYCENEGAVTATDIVGGIIANRAANGNYDNTNYCTNSGTVTLTGKASVNSIGYAGGLFGYGGYKIDNSSNNGTVIASEEASNHSDVYVGGLQGFAQKNTSYPTTITNCTNNGDIIAKASAAGGITGYVEKNTINITDTVNNGNITFIGIKASSFTAAGGILGHGNGGAGNVTVKANISYCINNGNIVSAPTSSGRNERFGGMVGRLSNPMPFAISNCINNGDISVSLIDSTSGWAGGVIGVSQNWGNTTEYTSSVTDCVNTGTISAPYAAGVVGQLNTGADKGKVGVGYLTADGFVNSGKISGLNYSALVVAYQDRDGNNVGTLACTANNCANVGELYSNGIVSGGITASEFIDVTMNNNLISGKFSGNGKRYILAPSDVTGSGNCYNANEASLTTADFKSGATAEADINTRINESSVIFDREGAKYVYDYVKANHPGVDTTAIEKYVINNRGDSNYEYFTATQAQLDAARVALESAISGGGETSYVITISPDVKLAKDGGSVNVNITNPKLSTKVTVSATQGGSAGDNFALTCGDQTLEFWFVQDGKVVKQGQNLFEFNGTSNGTHSFGAQIKDEAKLYPGTYTGNVTFDFALSE